MSTANLDSADLKGVAYNGLINEDVMQRIIDISSIELPLTSMIGTTDAKNSYKEWTQDTLAAPDVTNAVVDGADASGNDTQTGARVGNHCQISTKVVRVSTRADNSDTIGRTKELAYQIMRRSEELRRDVEAIMLTEQASVADDGNTTAGKSGGLGAWLETNTDRGATGADGGFSSGVVAAPTDGTARALSEATIRSVAGSVYDEGGNPSVLMSVRAVTDKVSAHMFSGNAGIAALQSDVNEKKTGVIATGAVSTFVMDNGISLNIVPNRLQQLEDTDDANVYLIDPSMLEIAYLHGYRVEPLAKTGLADNRQMAVDWTLCVKTEKAHGLIADVNPTLAMTS